MASPDQSAGNPGKSTPLRAGHLPMAGIIDAYMAHYTGRDPTRTHRLEWWSARVGHVALCDLDDDVVHSHLEALAESCSRYFAGLDANGNRIFKARRKPVSPATVNRYAAALAAVITWTIKRRIAPKGYVHPCRTVERRTENNARTRFLSDDERCRLLAACGASKCQKLYLLTLLAVTTGARLGELTGLRWGDVDLQAGIATVERTKNSDARALPLTEAARDELRKFAGAPDVLVFESSRSPGKVRDYRKPFNEALRVAGIRGFTFHCLRHSAASMLAKKGATLLEIADVLGHRQLQVTKRYSHLCSTHKAALVGRVMGEVR